jgi:alkanesulfonate monooxygenase SsuD/methylene tetrahydromethanopterin reductase-like flavin-dependent oxidoreductase (luciferase family)
VKIAYSLPLRRPDGTAPSAREIISIAKTIEECGFAGIWVGDALARGRGIFPDPLMWLAVAAGATQRVELGTAVMQVPIREPVDFTQRLLSLHALSEGRFSFGVGTGSNENDYKATGFDFSKRFSSLSENLATIRRLALGDKVGDAKFDPWPNTVGGPPILIGSWFSSVWIERAAREFDGWISSGGGPGGSNFGNLRTGIKKFRQAGGKRALIATVWVDLTAEDAPLSDTSRFMLRCSPDEALRRIKAAGELGYDDLILRKDDLIESDVVAMAKLLGL